MPPSLDRSDGSKSTLMSWAQMQSRAAARSWDWPVFPDPARFVSRVGHLNPLQEFQRQHR